MSENLTKGQQAEQAAADYLMKQGYILLARHYCCRGGELDLVAEHDGCLVFAEVKYRSSSAYGSPEEAITPQKIRSLSRAAAAYLAEKGGWEGAMSFDVIAVLGPTMTEVRHYVNAFTPFGLA